VPKLRKLSLARRNELKANLEFGEGRILINEASVSELMRGLKLSKEQATAIVAKRRAVGDFENIDQIRDIPGFSPSTFARVRERLNDDSGRAYFSARAFDASSASTGYAPVNANATTPVMNTDGVVTDEPAKLSSGVIDLFNRAKSGDTFKVAMYGLSATTPEYGALVDAAERGVAVKVVLNSAYNSSVAYALEALRVSGLPIDVRIQKSKTMHMKFGVVNDDVFLGSANFSNSAANKHSEDRFVIKNNAGLSQDYDAEFERVWAKSKPVIPD